PAAELPDRERPQVRRGTEVDEGWGRGDDLAADREDVELRAERGGVGAQRGRVDRFPRPETGVEAVQQGARGGDGLRRGERAVAGPVHEGLPEQRPGFRAADAAAAWR